MTMVAVGLDEGTVDQLRRQGEPIGAVPVPGI
jgi:hypothetical protein